MSHPLPTGAQIGQAVEKIGHACGLMFRSVLLGQGVIVPQHKHDHDHASYIASGSARLWIDGVWEGDYTGGDEIEIKAQHEHLFQALEPNTRIVCVWPENLDELPKAS